MQGVHVLCVAYWRCRYPVAARGKQSPRAATVDEGFLPDEFRLSDDACLFVF